jgi:hypothetical protein
MPRRSSLDPVNLRTAIPVCQRGRAYVIPGIK